MSIAETGKIDATAAVPPTKVGRLLNRQIFTTSRLADFASRAELERQTGHSASFWPEVILKEAIDNSLDACEAAGVAPVIRIEVGPDGITVEDNGGGIGAETIERILNYNFKTSSNAVYVSPTRGQQGNALQTLLAMAHALTGKPGVTVIESRGVQHRITFDIDPISREPRLDHQRTEILPAPGTRIEVKIPLSDDRYSLCSAAYDCASVNPHLTLTYADAGSDDHSLNLPATDPSWRSGRRPIRPARTGTILRR